MIRFIILGEMEMTPKCRSYVIHYELVSMRDYTFSYKFKKACQDDIKKLCASVITQNDKTSVIRCLSSIMLNFDLLGESDTNVPKLDGECKNQMKAEYFQMRQVDEAIDVSATVCLFWLLSCRLTVAIIDAIYLLLRKN